MHFLSEDYFYHPSSRTQRYCLPSTLSTQALLGKVSVGIPPPSPPFQSMTRKNHHLANMISSMSKNSVTSFNSGNVAPSTVGTASNGDKKLLQLKLMQSKDIEDQEPSSGTRRSVSMNEDIKQAVQGQSYDNNHRRRSTSSKCSKKKLSVENKLH